MSKVWLHSFYRRYLYGTNWNIGLVRVSPADIEKLVMQGKLGRVQWCPDLSPFRFRADPFIWLLEGDPRVIYEEMDYLKKRAHIRSRPISGFARIGASRAEIAQPFHLSYPYILHCDGDWYCVPESARAEGVDLYAWDRLAADWILQKRLIDGVGILDATLFQYGGVWYLLGTIRREGSYDTLRIWWSESLTGYWQRHRLDPAKIDICSARPAGPPFEFRGHWYRPAQDCTNGYGGALTINRIDVLTPHEFQETTVSRVEPDVQGPYPDGLHTLVVAGDVVLVDGKREGFAPLLPLVKGVRRMAGWFGVD